jgi:hypothetical protein
MMLAATTFSRLPEAYHLHKVNWQLFGTGTMRNHFCSRGYMLKKLIATIRQVCRVYFRKDAKQIMLFCRFEKPAELMHAHFLVAGIPGHLDPNQFGLAFTRQWNRHAGICHVVPYDADRNGIGYVTKCSPDDNAHDLAQPYFSPALIRYLGASAAVESPPQNTHCR